MSDALIPFKVEVSDEAIADLRERLARTRWPDAFETDGWTYGMDIEALKALCRYWASDYDWAAFASRCNAAAQFTTMIDGQQIHFYHLRSPEPEAKPLILSHGWPGSVVEFHKVMAPLADPRAHGADPADAFHVIAPSLPGFGFSGPTSEPGWDSRRITAAFAELMSRLGYERFFAQGGDKGTLISLLLAEMYPERVEAIHLNILPIVEPDGPDPTAGLKDADLAALAANSAFAAHGSGYISVQRTRPQALAVGLMDSPAGLAAWLLDKFHSWSDCQGDVEAWFGRDRLLDNISIYWLTGTIGSSMRHYFEDMGPGRLRRIPSIATPIGYAVFPREIIKSPRAWGEKAFNIARWRQMPRGGHFAAMEVPDLFVEEVRTFFREFRAE